MLLTPVGELWKEEIIMGRCLGWYKVDLGIAFLRGPARHWEKEERPFIGKELLFRLVHL